MNKESRRMIGVTVVAVAILMLGTSLTPQMQVATIAYATMVAGFVSRRTRPRAHIALMCVAMALDLGLVLSLQLQRDAIATALSFSLGPLQQAHIAVSSVATALYLPLIYLGIRKLGSRGGMAVAAFDSGTSSAGIRVWHRRLGVAAFAFRSAGFLLMFSMLWK